MQQPSIKKLTDQVFNLAEPLVNCMNRCRTVNETNTAVKQFLKIHLPAFLPKSGYWFDDGEVESHELQWVVAPFIYEAMGYTYTSVALLHTNELLLGVLFNWQEKIIITGEKGNGANIFDKSLKVNAVTVNKNARHMGYLPKTETQQATIFKKHQPFFDKLHTAIESRRETNHVMSNLPFGLTKVAENNYAFVYACGFNFAQAAAAVAIAEEAGALCTDFSGGKQQLFAGNELICANEKIHRLFVPL